MRRWLGRLTLQARIGLAVFCLLALSLSATALVIGLHSSRQAEASTMALARSGSRDAAGALENELRPHLRAVVQLASMASHTSEAGRPPSRDQLDDMVKGLLSEQPDVLSAGFIWEPDALDGRDAEYAGRAPRFDETGQYKVLWHREPDGNFLAQPVQLTAPGVVEWYEALRQAGQPFFMDPYAYPVDGKEVLATSFVVPIRVKGRFRGVVFADFALTQLAGTLAGIKSVDGADMALVSNAGLYAAHPDAALLQKPAEDIPVDGLEAIKSGRPHQYEDAAGRMHLLQPVVVRADMPPWAVRVSFPKALATQAARELMQDTLITAVLCAAVATALLLWLLHRLMLPLRDLSQAMNGLSAGEADLSVQLDARGHDELALIARGFNGFVQKVNGSLWRIREASASILVAAREIASGNNDLSARTEGAASSLQQTASSIECLSTNVEQTARAAEQVSQLAVDASAAAARGGDMVCRVVETMAEIHQSSRQVADITGVIDAIAFQTNILAHNATVEAARAGEQGRGFAVVAEEIRTLAQRSAEAAKQIKALIQDAASRVDQGGKLVKSAGQTMRHLVDAVQTLAGLISDIRHATGEQSRSLQDINAAVTHLDRATQQNASLVEEAAAAAESLREQSAGLAQVASSFKLGDERPELALASGA